MASVMNRSKKKSNPNWCAKVKLLSGKWSGWLTTDANTKDQARAIAGEMQLRANRGLPPRLRDEAGAGKSVGDLMDAWLEQLSNRNAADDRSCTNLHVRPHWAELSLPAVNMQRVVAYLDAIKLVKGDDGGPLLSGASQRKCFNLLSRFFSWCVERGHLDHNPCRMIPTNSKTRPSGRAEKPRTQVVRDEAITQRIFHELRAPFHLIFLLGREGGLRPGEACGLRLSDVDRVADGAVRVRFSRLGPLKEDKGGGKPKVKWAPVGDDLIPLLCAWKKRREDQGAGGEDLMFPQDAMPREERSLPDTARGKPIQSAQLAREWRRMKKALARAGTKLPADLDQYSATRHTFVTLLLEAGEQLQAVSEAIGHADERVTKEHYAHALRKAFPASMRRGIGLTGAGGLSAVK